MQFPICSYGTNKASATAADLKIAFIIDKETGFSLACTIQIIDCRLDVAP